MKGPHWAGSDQDFGGHWHLGVVLRRWGAKIALVPSPTLPSHTNDNRETKDGANHALAICSVLTNNQRRIATTFGWGSTIWAINKASASNASRFSS